MSEPCVLMLQNKDDGKTVVYLEYWKDDSFAQ